MECNKRNRNIRYAIFRDSNLKKLSEYLVLQSNIFLYFCDRFSKLKRFFPVSGPIIFTLLADLTKRNVALFWEWLLTSLTLWILLIFWLTSFLINSKHWNKKEYLHWIHWNLYILWWVNSAKIFKYLFQIKYFFHFK